MLQHLKQITEDVHSLLDRDEDIETILSSLIHSIKEWISPNPSNVLYLLPVIQREVEFLLVRCLRGFNEDLQVSLVVHLDFFIIIVLLLA